MAAAKHNIIVSRGEDFSFTLTVADSNGAINITGDTFTAEIRRAGGKPLVASFSFVITNASNGVVDATLPKAETLKLDGNTAYKWDLFRFENTASATTRLIYGDVKVENNITDI
tara:strand:- start:377 stop:718 length:342 start_codon:yes stop_codon:yes gene_type:complete